jgi:hypothetical protein
MSTEPTAPPHRPRRPQTPAQRFVRLWLPLIIIVAGILVALIGQSEPSSEGGALIVSAGLSVWLLNAFFRIGVRGDRERAQESRARDEFERTGHWPDEPDEKPE